MSVVAKGERVTGAPVRSRLAGGVASQRSALVGCWVSREIYGIRNRKWLAFREWLYFEAPSWLHLLSMRYGKTVVRYIKNKPWLKAKLKSWMDTKLDPDLDLNAPKFSKLEALYLSSRRAKGLQKH